MHNQLCVPKLLEVGYSMRTFFRNHGLIAGSLLLVGVLGGFTTFSTFTAETIRLD